MSVETTVLTGLSQYVDVKQVERLKEGKSFDFIPHGYPMDHKYGIVTGHGSFMTRMTDARILKLSLRSETITEFVDMTKLQAHMNDRNSRTMFGTIRLAQKRSEGQAVFTVNVEHTLGLRAVNDAHVAEVISDMMSLFHDAMVQVGYAIKNETRRMTDEARALTKQLKDLGPKPRLNTPLNAVLEELNALVGLAEVKTFVNGLVAQHKVAGMRHQHGLPMIATSPHLVFSGNPGTGKTTVARLIGRIYKHLGLLEKGHVVEVDRSSLVGVYMGQTAIKTKEVCEKALGGVLFIDEAYSLDVDGRDYGTEAIEALLTFMEEHRGNIAVVVAGYPDEMEKFMQSNPGLNSRFDVTVNFADYTADDLMQIFTNLVSSNTYELSPGASLDMKTVLAHMAMQEKSGNARDVRKIFHEVLAGHAHTMTTIKNPSAQQLQLITSAAIPNYLTRDMQIALEDLPPL